MSYVRVSRRRNPFHTDLIAGVASGIGTTVGAAIGEAIVTKRSNPKARRGDVTGFVMATGISYVDRSREVDGDYVKIAFLPFDDLNLTFNSRAKISPEQRAEVLRAAGEIIARRGEAYEVSTSGQTVVLGYKLPKRKNPAKPLLVVENPSGDATYDKLKRDAERTLRRKLSASECKLLAKGIKEFRTFHGCEPTGGLAVRVPDGTPAILAATGEVLETNYAVKFPRSERKGLWTHKAGDHGRTGKRTKAPFLAWVPGKKGPPIFAEPRGADLRFKPTHGIVG